MRSRTLLLLALSLVAAACGSAPLQESVPPKDSEAPDAKHPETLGLVPRLHPGAPTAAYTNALWYRADGSGFDAGERYAIDGVFVRERPMRVDTVLDLGGAYVVPPFGEAHNHNVDGFWTAGTAQRYLDEGTFYHKNPNDIAAFVTDTLFNRPERLDVVFAHAGVSIAGGHPEGLYSRMAERQGLDPDSLDGVAFIAAPTVEALEARWPELMAMRPGAVKLYALYHDRPAGRESAGLAPEVLRRAVELTHAAGLRAVVHVETAADLALAVDAGADEAAHLPGYFWARGLGADDYRISDALAARMAEAGFVVATTTAVTEGMVARGVPPERNAAAQRLQAENLRRLADAGVPLAVGTDAYEHTARQEVRALDALGVFSAAELVRMWTETPRRAIFPDRAIGRLSAGYEASFVALGCDPTAELPCVDAIRQRVKQGAILGAPPAE